MGILAHNSLLPQDAWEGSAGPKRLCCWDMCSAPGRALGAPCSWHTVRPEQERGAWITLANPGSTHWRGVPGNFETLLIWPDLTFKWRRDAYLQHQLSLLLPKCCSKVWIVQNMSDKYLGIRFGKTTIYSHSLKYLNLCWDLTPISSKKKKSLKLRASMENFSMTSWPQAKS